MEFVRSVHNTVNTSVSTSESACHDVMHYLPSISDLDPRLQDCYKGARMAKSPKYGLGYVEQCNSVIPPSRFSNPLPPSMTRPATEEILKYLTVIHGCPKNQFPGRVSITVLLPMKNKSLHLNGRTTCRRMNAGFHSILGENLASL
jgi:hypothetical protein